MKRPTIDQLKEYFDYNKETGVFIWKKSRPTFMAVAGNVAGSKCTRGYIKLQLLGMKFFARHAAFAFVYGRWPNDGMVIDHINRVTSDNRICNLRECTIGDNLKNRKAQSNNKLGVKGVHMHRGRYCATIRVNNKPTHIGYFNTLDEAAKAYRNKANEIYGEFAAF